MNILFALRLAVVLFAMLSAVSQAQDLDELQEQGQVENRAELEQIIAQEPKAGLSPGQLTSFFDTQSQAAWRLGDLSARKRILRNWIKAVPDSTGARWQLWLVLSDGEERAEGLELGESVLKLPMWQRDRVRAGSYLAGQYLDDGNFSRAKTLLDAAEKTIANKFGGEQSGADEAHRTTWALQRFFQAQCQLSRSLHQINRALEQCLLAEDHGRKLVDLSTTGSVSSPNQFYSVGTYVGAVLSLASAQLAAARPFDAAVTARRAMLLAKTHKLGRVSLGSFYRVSVGALTVQHDYTGAERVAREGIRVLAGSQPLLTDQLTVGLKSSLLLALVGQERWSDAQVVLASLDLDVANNPMAQRQARNMLARAVAAIMTARPETVLNPMQATLSREEERFGADHMATGFTRGIYGMALAASLDATAQARALPELARAVAAITAPSSLGEAYADAGLHRLYRRLILEKYLDLSTRQNADAGTVAATFRVADYLRGSTVQRALSEAAVRSAAGSVGLADVVRRDQDASNELRGLHAFIAEQSGRGQERRVEATVAQMKQRIDDLEWIRRALKVEIARQFPSYDLLVNPQPPTPAEIAQRLGADEVFISLLPTKNFVYVWAISKSRVAFHRAALDEVALRALVQRIRRTLDVAGSSGKTPRFDAEASYALYEKLLKPVAANLEGAKSFTLAPSGVLGQVPMGVLLSAPWAGSDPAQAPWLIKQAAISHVASASAWMSLNTFAKAQAANESFAAWGDPLFDKARLQKTAAATRTLALTRAPSSHDIIETPRAALTYSEIPALPETRLEIEAIAASLGSNAANDAYFGDRATRESVLSSSKSGLLAKKRVIAFATHGLMAGDLPNLTQPALAMAATGTEAQNPLAPLLTLEDVLTLKLNADWVVLSACNTAAADGRAEEALGGLARGFFYAGSRSLLVTHWAVESESAKELTTNTFAHYTANPAAPRAESLRQAMLKVMAMPQYSHPAFWAPYALVGDGGR